MSDISDQIKDGCGSSSSIKLTASPFTNIVKQEALNNDVPATAYRICNSSSNIPCSQFSSIGNSILKPGIPKLSAHEVGDEVNMCPVILHPTKQLSSQVIKSEGLVKTIGFSSARSQISTQHQSRIVSSSLQHSIMESQNVSPLIITPTPHVIHTNNDVVPAKIVPIPPSTPLSSHFSVISKSVSDYAGMRQSMSGAHPVYTQSDFARFPPKTYHHKSSPILNPAVIHGPITSGHVEESGLTIPNSQHLFKPIISPRPSILRKRDADGVLRAQKNLIPILTKTENEDCQNSDETSLNRNGYSETGLQLDSIMVPQIPEIVLPQISALSRQSHIMVEISPRKKPRKQLLPVNQDSPFKIVGDEMVYVDEKIVKTEKAEEFPDEDVVDCNEDECKDDYEDDFDDMDLDDECPADDDYDENDDDDDDFGDGFDFKPDKPFYEEAKAPGDLSDENSSCTNKPKNKRPTLLGNMKNTWKGHSHHFQKYTDFKIKETKKQLAEMQQAKKWLSDSRTGWRVHYLLKQFDEMVKNEDEIIDRMTKLIKTVENRVEDIKERNTVIELVKDNIQRSKVTKIELDEITDQLNKIFDCRPLIDDVVEKYCPKELKKKSVKIYNKPPLN